MDLHAEPMTGDSKNFKSRPEPKTYDDLGQGLKIVHNHEFADIE
jgi:hypothetical protein